MFLTDVLLSPPLYDWVISHAAGVFTVGGHSERYREQRVCKLNSNRNKTTPTGVCYRAFKCILQFSSFVVIVHLVCSDWNGDRRLKDSGTK